jgi:hypothetical protein
MQAVKAFLKTKKSYDQWKGNPPPYLQVERLALMFGLLLLNVWQCDQCARDPELASIDKVPSHVVDGIHKDVDEVSKLIGPVVISLEQSLDPPVAGPSGQKGAAR